MRIIGGNKARIRINPPKNLKLRPTTDRCKESLFNIINNDFDNSTGPESTLNYIIEESRVNNY